MILKHKDRELLRFDWVQPFGVKNVELNNDNMQFLPLDFRDKAREGDSEALIRKLEDWLLRRSPPMERKFMKQLLTGLGFDPRDPRYLRRLIEFSLGLSLTDVHWLVPEDFTSTWSQCNLYDNVFSREISELAFSGVGRVKIEDITTSPEMTTNGALAKCWRRDEKGIWLYKTGRDGTGDEPYSEFYASQLASALKLPHVDYRLSKFKGKICSVCRLFTSNDVSFLPVGRLLSREEAIQDSRFADIFFFDALILNPDRHMGNFGFLVDNATNEISGVAPIFDNGHGLFSQGPVKDFSHKFTPALYDDWFGFPGGITNSMKARLYEARAFTYKHHKYYNIPISKFNEIQKFQRQLIFEICGFNLKSSKSQTSSAVCDTKTPKDLGAAIIAALIETPSASRQKLSSILKVGEATIGRWLKKLSATGAIERVGSKTRGYWQVVEQPK